MRYGLIEICLEDFLGSLESTASIFRPGHRISALCIRISLYAQPTCLHGVFQHSALSILLRLSITLSSSTRIINSFPISYAFQPCLRGRLTLGRLPLPRKPWGYGEQVFHLFYRYSCQHNHFLLVHGSLTSPLLPKRNAPLPSVT